MIETHYTATASAHYARMGRPECIKIHAASLEILERVGIDVHDERARELLVQGGARADGLRVRIPEYMVRRALDQAPERLTLYNRQGQVAIRAWGYNTHFGGGSDCLNVLDHRTGQRRRPRLQDVVEAVTVQDALPELGSCPKTWISASMTATRWRSCSTTPPSPSSLSRPTLRAVSPP